MKSLPLDHPGVDVGAEVDTAPEVSIVLLVLETTDHVVACLDSIRDRVRGGIRHEVIVLANGTSLAQLAPLQRREDIILVRSDVNLGFAGGCNRAARFARGRWLVFLNDDSQVMSGWLENLVRTARRHPRAGAVGARILNVDGSVQEAGSILWNDARATGVGRGLPAGSAEYMYVREVDFCSANSLLVPRAAFAEVDGFSSDYFPAYYEDVDLCLRLRRAGHQILYEPRATIRHMESMSTAQRYRVFLSAQHLQTLKRNWRDALALHVAPPAAGAHVAAVARAVTRARGAAGSVLIIDDCIPDPGLGSGFGRMLAAVREFTAASYSVTISPRLGSLGDRAFHASGDGVADELADLGVDIRSDSLEHHLSTPGVHYDAVIVSRPTNVRRSIPALRRHQPHAHLIYDAEALWHRRMERQAELESNVTRAAELAADARTYRTIEQEAVNAAEHVVCISDDEAALVRLMKPEAAVSVVRPTTAASSWGKAGFWDRDVLVFTAGWLAGVESPNHDAL